MKSRELQSNKHIPKKPVLVAAVLLLLAVTAATVFFYRSSGFFTVRNAKTNELYARYLVHDGDGFSIGFIHSVNQSPVTDYYEFLNHTIYVEKTVYYGFGAGVQTQIEDGQSLEYGEDGSMIVSGFHKEIPDLLYIVGTVSDHILVINGGEEISLRDLCGRNTMVRFSYETLLGGLQ